MADEFFEQRQGAAVLKHGILKRYLALFTSKLGKTSTGNRVFYLDAYAGAGEYDSGEEGSPAIAAQTAAALAANRNLFGIYVEEDDTNFEKLKAFLAGSSHQHERFHGSIEDHIDDVLNLVGSAPLLAFIDPFGLPIPIEQLRRLLERPKEPDSPFAPTTELIINVSYPGIARVCGMLTSKAAETNPSKARQRDTMVRKCNEQLGGELVAVDRTGSPRHLARTDREWLRATDTQANGS